jgi:hypothetical protein
MTPVSPALATEVRFFHPLNFHMRDKKMPSGANARYGEVALVNVVLLRHG